MARKILDGLTIFSFVVVVLGVGAGTYSYLWITNEKNQENLKQQLMEQVTKSLKMPSLSGPAMPEPNKSFSPPKF